MPEAEETNQDKILTHSTIKFTKKNTELVRPPVAKMSDDQ